MPILDAKGQPYAAPVQNKKAAPPKTGNAFGDWAGRDLSFLKLPGGGIVQFNLDNLTLADFRTMRDHYQVNASLSVLSFMQHQADWMIECEDKKIADFCTEQIRNNWTGLNRALAQANWAGFSPAALEWENKDGRVILDKVKDLVPEECAVNWKEEEGWAPPGYTKPKFKTYDGIVQFGQSWAIPVENSLWYPMLMENGNYAGKKLLRPAFQSYFFSILLHLFANRYYERFGEPVPVGRAPFDDSIAKDGQNVPGNEYMLGILQALRNRSAVVLPNDKTPVSEAESNPDFDYQIEYLESQMRGADFERYMTRLDEEISLGLFTPILLMRTADVGSYNLGVGHMQVYLWMLNAMNDDRKVYIDKYLLRKMADYNFGPNSPSPRIKFRKLGNTDATVLQNMVTTLINSGTAAPDLDELGQAIGMTLHEVRETTAPAPEPGADDPDAPDDPNAEPAQDSLRLRGTTPRDTVKEIVARVRPQVEARWETPDKAMAGISMGFKRRMLTQFNSLGKDPENVERLYMRMDTFLNVVSNVMREFDTADEFLDMFERTLESEVDHALSS